MATLRVYSLGGRILPKSEQINIRVYSLKAVILDKPNIRVHNITATAAVYRVRIRRGMGWTNVRTYVRKSNTWK